MSRALPDGLRREPGAAFWQFPAPDRVIFPSSMPGVCTQKACALLGYDEWPLAVLLEHAGDGHACEPCERATSLLHVAAAYVTSELSPVFTQSFGDRADVEAVSALEERRAVISVLQGPKGDLAPLPFGALEKDHGTPAGVP